MKKDSFFIKIFKLDKAIPGTVSGEHTSPKQVKRLSCLALFMALSLSSCDKYLDVVPDNVPTIEHAFKLRNEAEKYLFTCYSYLPRHGDGWYNAGLMSGDEIWLPQDNQVHWHTAFRIAQGQQNKDAPLFDEWGGARKGGTVFPYGGAHEHRDIFVGIRHCNIFLENIRDERKVPDLSLDERTRWIGEVEFLKAFYHFYMMRMYGPIPILDVAQVVEEPTAKRMPIDETVNYISNLLDQAAEKLPLRIADENNQLGRITQPIALALKAKLWLYAASPLFNGNTDMANLRDKQGVVLFNQVYDATKWVKARDAAKAAIEAAEQTGHALYEYRNDVLNLSPETKTTLNIRNAVTERWGKEHVWAFAHSYFVNEAIAMPPMERGVNNNRFQLQAAWSAPLKIAKMFYTKNGVPIEEDKELDFNNYLEIRRGTAEERFYIEPNQQTARLNFDREPRFYADLGFDGGVWYMKDGNSTGSDVNTFFVKSKNNERAGFGHFTNWNETGYFVKKLVHWESTTNSNNAPTWKAYPWPEIRLADLYLMYAEALNEVEGGSPLAIQYLDRIRERAGLKGVVESWTNFSKNPSKYNSQDGLRQIIQRERSIELVFEGHRVWDLKRWKLAAEELNKDITGMNVMGRTAETYNNERVIHSQNFIAPRDYFWPIGNWDIRRNQHLVENLGW